MSIVDTQNHIKARVWQAIAKSEIDLSAVPKSELDALVELVADAAMIEADDEIGKSIDDKGVAGSDSNLLQEKILWQGRPFLSVSTNYLITDERIRVIHGLIGKDREDVELIRIQDIDLKQTLSDRILNVGDITILSHDSSHPELLLENVRDPDTVHEMLRRAVLNARKAHGLSYREEM
jgi:hypothetical protein